MNSTGAASSALHIEGGALSVAGRKAENQDAVAVHRPEGEARAIVEVYRKLLA